MQTAGSTDAEEVSATTVVLDVVVPVYNEEAGLETCVRRLRRHLRTQVPFSARITIADNASVDGTLALARSLAEEFDDVRVVHLDAKGRGRALRQVWSDSDATWSRTWTSTSRPTSTP